VRKTTSRTTRPAVRRARGKVAPSASYREWLIESLKDPKEAAAYLEAAIEEGDQAGLLRALRNVAEALGGIAQVAKAANLNRETLYRTLSEGGNPELRSLTAILGAAGLRLSVKPLQRRRARGEAEKLAA
jgi:probable addiction module antidote protein